MLDSPMGSRGKMTSHNALLRYVCEMQLSREGVQKHTAEMRSKRTEQKGQRAVGKRQRWRAKGRGQKAEKR